MSKPAEAAPEPDRSQFCAVCRSSTLVEKEIGDPFMFCASKNLRVAWGDCCIFFTTKFQAFGSAGYDDERAAARSAARTAARSSSSSSPENPAGDFTC